MTTISPDKFSQLFAGADAKTQAKLTGEVFPLLRACADQGAISSGDLKMVKKVLDACVKTGFAATVAAAHPEHDKPGDSRSYNHSNALVVRFIEWNRFDKLRANLRKLSTMDDSPAVEAARAFIADAQPLLDFLRDLEGQSLKNDAGAKLDASMFPLLEAVCNERTFASFTKTVLPCLNQSIDAQSIANVDYEGCKDVINRLIAEAAKTLVKEAYLNSDRQDEAASDLYYADFSLTRIEGIGKKAAKMDQTNPVARAATKLCQEVAPLVPVMTMLKTLIVKGRKPNPDAPQPYVPPAASKATIDQLTNILNEITSDNYQALVTSTQNWLTKLLDAYADKRETMLQANPKAKATPRTLYKNDQGAAHILDQLTDWQTGAVKPTDECTRIIKSLSEKSATQMMSGFKEKNLAKLSPIIGEKNNLSEVLKLRAAVRDRTFEGTLKLEFEDGSNFVVNSQVVWAYHNGGNFGRGGWVMRYPTTFHDVILSNGEKMSQPSEEKMNEVFAKSANEPTFKA
jgi:hypothetical protein